MASAQSKEERLKQLRAEVAQLESEVKAEQSQTERWKPTEFYASYYATTGFFLGMFGAVTSLLFNVVGSAIARLHPLRIIQVYLTFPLGEKAFTSEMDSGIVLAIGCCLYIGTGMLLGIVFQLVLAKFAIGEPFGKRMLIATGLGAAIWVVNFYLILSWLQPLLFGGNWILAQMPWYVGLATHLVFAWTMAIVFPLGLYQPYRLQTEQQ
jgi:hypothetical protein